jgi:hypothetical protein
MPGARDQAWPHVPVGLAPCPSRRGWASFPRDSFIICFSIQGAYQASSSCISQAGMCCSMPAMLQGTSYAMDRGMGSWDSRHDPSDSLGSTSHHFSVPLSPSRDGTFSRTRKKNRSAPCWTMLLLHVPLCFMFPDPRPLQQGWSRSWWLRPASRGYQSAGRVSSAAVESVTLHHRLSVSSSRGSRRSSVSSD